MASSFPDFFAPPQEGAPALAVLLMTYNKRSYNNYSSAWYSDTVISIEFLVVSFGHAISKFNWIHCTFSICMSTDENTEWTIFLHKDILFKCKSSINCESVCLLPCTCSTKYKFKVQSSSSDTHQGISTQQAHKRTMEQWTVGTPCTVIHHNNTDNTQLVIVATI